jgi:Rhodopirellula transposase DDE domain
MNDLKWCRRTTHNIAELLCQCGLTVSANTIARLLHGMKFSLRVNQKKIATSGSPDPNLQFDYIADLRERFQRGRMPVISVDSKKREIVGLFKNSGARWDREPWAVNDHDFLQDAIGVAIPYGIYQPVQNRGSVVVGVSHDTAAFAAHAIAHWWQREGLSQFPRSRQLLILADSGGSNGYRRRTWKTELQDQLADPFGLNITVAHYPTGTSKWNPIEHRLFSEISKHWAGEPLDSYQKILNFIRTSSTKTGLAVSAYLDRRHYSTGVEPAPDQLDRLRLEPHDTLPRWNYTIKSNRPLI